MKRIDFERIFDNIRRNQTMVHCITNYVTINDVANMILAIGASPIMADDWMEVREITSMCDSLVINMGTLKQNTVRSMLLREKKRINGVIWSCLILWESVLPDSEKKQRRNCLSRSTLT